MGVVAHGWCKPIINDNPTWHRDTNREQHVLLLNASETIYDPYFKSNSKINAISPSWPNLQRLERNWGMYNQIKMCTSKKTQTSEIPLVTERAADHLRCLMAATARSARSRMTCDTLGDGGKDGQNFADKKHQQWWTVTGHFQQVCLESPPVLMFYCGWIEEMSPTSPPESFYQLWIPLKLLSELSRETWGGHVLTCLRVPRNLLELWIALV